MTRQNFEKKILLLCFFSTILAAIFPLFTMLTSQQVQHIAKLARLGLQSHEVQKFVGQLDSIFTCIDTLNEVDTTGVEPTSQVTGLKNVMRGDKVERFCQRDELLSCSELPIIQDQIKVKPAITT